MAADTAPFPPHSWLGYGLDLTSITPTNITTVTQHVLRAIRIIELKRGGTVQTYGGVTWTVPDNVNVAADAGNSETSQTSYTNGSVAASNLEADASLSGQYLAVSAGASANYSISKTFHSSYQYFMFNFRQVLLEVGLENFAENQYQRACMAHVVKTYKTFFGTFGSHVVTGTTYGSRFQLAQFNGLTASGNFDASIKTTDQYKTFETSVQKNCSCQGGDTSIGTKIASDPTTTDVYTSYASWTKSSQTTPGVMTMQTMSLWELMTAAMDDTLNLRAGDVEKAFSWIVENPATHHTKCTLIVNSDWGEVGLLNPSAFIIPDPDNPPPTDKTIFSRTKIRWGLEHSHDFQREIRIDFIIQNDGSPVDIELSHGSDGSTSGSGACSAIIGNEPQYDNTGIQDNNWNTKWFYKCPVNPNPVARQP
ncbi:predicted protein [Uncinocarpus reesii 1704]|uniref:MACPF domain-containing protein n=1 Tax=Uncinocarpus reesii (strain UAMH 1704) TaxID=336963 RepID=C4JS74_UNCRE|nr:uncharacterized protein UREG_05313 [Uncinocarpus reesii 1704]EEP80471.1 predicted protein [Uncinocarpus reesii 1704]